MTTEEDLDLRAPTSGRLETQKNSTRGISIFRTLGVIISLVAIVVCGFLLFNLFKDTVELPLPDLITQQESPSQTVRQQASSIDQPAIKKTASETDAAQTSVNQPPLPQLNDSDKAVRDAASQLNPAEKWSEWVNTDEAIRKFVVVINNLASGKISTKYIPIPKPTNKFSSSQNGEKKYLDSASFKRYSPYINVFTKIDNDKFSALYQRYSPLMEQAFSELGYTNKSFHDTLMKAFDVLLSAPIVTKDIELIQPSVFYKFADPALENQSDVDKQMVRMGPENTAKLQAKIRELKAALKPANQ